MENRRRLIKEVLDSDKNINVRVSNIQRQKLLGVTEDVTPYIQLNQSDINKMKLYASALRFVLEKRYLLTNNFLSDIANMTQINRYIIETAQTEDVISAYNKVVSIYLNPRNTQETKSYIGRILIAFNEMVHNIAKNLFEILTNIKNRGSQEHIKLIIYSLTLYKIILEQLGTGVFHIITNTDMKHEFNINLQLYKTSTLAAAPLVTHQQFDMGADDDGGEQSKREGYEGYTEPITPYAEEYERYSDPGPYAHEAYAPTDFFTRDPYGESDRGIAESRARISRLGKPFEMTPSRSTYGMVNLLQTPEQVKSGDEPQSRSSSADPVGEPGGEPDGEPEEELPTRVDEPVSSSDFVYRTSSKKINYKGSARSHRSFQ